MRKLLIALGVVALLGADALVARLSVDQRLAEVVPATYYGSGPIQGMQFADYYLPFGGLPPADAAGICATGTSTSICPTVTDAHTWSATQTHSASTPLSLTAAGGATITHTSTTNPLSVSVSNAAAAGVGVSVTAASLPTPAAQNNYAGGVLQVIVPEPTNTSTPAPNAIELTGGVNLGGPFIIGMDSAASRDNLVFESNGTCTGVRKALQFLNGATASTNWFVTCAGAMQNASTFQYGASPFTANATTTNEFDSNSTGVTVPFELVSSNASAPTGDWFDVCYTSGGGSCASNKFAVINSGAAKAAPTINSVSVLSTLLPLYTATGATVAGTAHCVQGSAGSVSAASSVSITLTNNAVFASTSSYTVGTSITDNTGTLAQVLAPTTRNQATTSFTIDNNDAVNAHTIVYLACGV